MIHAEVAGEFELQRQFQAQLEGLSDDALVQKFREWRHDFERMKDVIREAVARGGAAIQVIEREVRHG